MANAYKDENGSNTITGVDSSNGTTIRRALADPSTHALAVENNTTGTNYGPAIAPKDENEVTTFWAVASRTVTSNGIDYVEGITPVPIYIDSSGQVLIDSN
ncbi:hypothetical protein E6Q11_03155 [Candidatus Dojkabacteria bacterium]|uniref:Uncharacterized protein n=1 Tax=Candidatus Dojkabacteria bacterium TaxID=2099670 RepID=A0A5C7J6Q0_9BACT|nr:MAG: hypothetical protein E6Q11_03155 [Candidatus Dojkabacteria bacterium]